MASLKEEIKVESADIVSDILKFDTNILNKEVKISYNKILTKADLEVNVIYLTKDGRIEKIKEKFPVMNFIELDNIKEENICTTDYQIRNILLKVNNGDFNSITVQIEYEVYCKAFENKEQEVVSDFYSLKYDTEFSKKEIEIVNDFSTKNVKKVDIDERVEIRKCEENYRCFWKK